MAEIGQQAPKYSDRQQRQRKDHNCEDALLADRNGVKIGNAFSCEKEDADVDQDEEYESRFDHIRPLFLFRDTGVRSVDTTNDTDDEGNCGWDCEELEESASS